MSPGGAAKRRLGVGGGGFTLGCGCRDAKAVALSASSPSSAATATTESSTATWRGARVGHQSASGTTTSTGTLTVPSASSSSFRWEDTEVEVGEEEVNNSKRRSSPAGTPMSFSGLLRELNELERNVKSCGRKNSTGGKTYFSQPPPPLPPPPLPSLPPAEKPFVRSGEEGHVDFSAPSTPPSFQFQTQRHRDANIMDKGVRQEEAEVHFTLPPSPPPPLPLLPEQLRIVTSTDDDKGITKDDGGDDNFPLKQARSFDSSEGGSVVAIVKQSDDPLGDFRRSMVSMIVENRIVTGDELRELLRHFLALNAPRHHDAILRAFTEIWDDAFSATKAGAHREEAARPTPPPRQRAPAPTPPRQTQRARTPPRQVQRTPTPPRQTQRAPTPPRQTQTTPTPPRQAQKTATPPRQRAPTPPRQRAPTPPSQRRRNPARTWR